MDPITHSLVGGMAAKTIGTTKRRFWVMMFLGTAPDFDVLFNGFGSWAFWLQHRGISHSILGIVAQALLYAWIFQKWDVGSYRQRASQYSLPLFFHSVCDYLTSFGVPFFSPFTFQDYSADLMGGLAVLPILFMSVGLFRLYQKGSFGWQAARPLWAGWFLYFVMALSGKAYASKLVEVHSAKFTTVPSVGNPFAWTALCAHEGKWVYQQFDVDLMEGHIRSVRQFSPDREDLMEASLKGVLTQDFVKTARWPVSRVSVTDKGSTVEWGTVMFSTRGVVRGKVRVELDKKGQILSEKNIFNFWNPPAA